MSERHENIRILREADQVFVRIGGGEKTPARLVWTRPIRGRGGSVSILDRGKKELALLPSPEVLDAESRRIALEELARRYLAPRITGVIRATANYGVRYWHVRTDRGERRFAMKNASRNAFWAGEDRLMLRDTLGCLYEIRPYSALDARSRMEVEKVI